VPLLQKADAAGARRAVISALALPKCEGSIPAVEVPPGV